MHRYFIYEVDKEKDESLHIDTDMARLYAWDQNLHITDEQQAAMMPSPDDNPFARLEKSIMVVQMVERLKQAAESMSDPWFQARWYPLIVPETFPEPSVAEEPATTERRFDIGWGDAVSGSELLGALDESTMTRQ